jgi:DNA transformation protein and related proteins
MTEIKGNRLYVSLSAAQTKRRLQGHGFGVRKVHSNGRNQAVIIHTATGRHEDELRALFADAISPERTG